MKSGRKYYVLKTPVLLLFDQISKSIVQLSKYHHICAKSVQFNLADIKTFAECENTCTIHITKFLFMYT